MTVLIVGYQLYSRFCVNEAKAISPAQYVLCVEFAAVLEVNDLEECGAGCQTAATVQISHPSAVLQHHYNYNCTGPGTLTHAHCRKTRNATGREREKAGPV